MDLREKHIIDGLHSGKESAFRELYDEYYIKLVMFAFRYLEDLDAARDQVQDLIVQLYEDRNDLNIQFSLKSYLYNSVRNRCLNYIKYRKVREKPGAEGNGSGQHPGNGYDPGIEENIDAAELEVRVHRIVSDLPEQCRRIFTMSRVDGLRNPEIAKELGISVRTVETQISKAIKILRNNLIQKPD